MKSTLWTFVAVLFVLVSTGCGPSSDMPELGTVTGVVTLDGQPLPGVTVKFVPAEGRTSSGLTDAGGKYELIYTRDVKGAPVGEHKVYISGAGAEGGGNPNEEGGGEGVPAVKPYTGTIPAKYNEESTLTATVESGSNTCNFDLESK